uniref:Lethal giant larvae homologue 2 domain-containing protein n=1 Tax=Timema shepardi TaxID=629360 RepID=A0A7R9AQH6_TIMSH|nr:unnamed protein product [Timema shepardi]
MCVSSQLLIGFETGQVVLWDLRTRTAEMRCQSAEPMRSISWHHEGKQFMCSHTDGSLTTWTVRQAPKPINLTLPHAKPNKEGKMETCKPIQKVEWKSSRTGEAYVIFSGGLTYDKAGRTPSITVIHGKTTTVLEMDNNVVDFVTLCESPWNSEFQDPYGIVVLLQNDLVVIDLLTPGYPCFENPYPMDLHESAVTCCTYLADCPSDLIPAFYSVGTRGNKRSGSQRPEFSEREWPICGGEWSPTSCSYNEIIITGHADGSIKFWDASAGTLQVLYKLKTAKVFEKPPSLSEDPFAIQLISLCPESRKLCVAGASCHVILFKFRKQESTAETCTLEIPIVYETLEEGDCSPDYEYPPRPSLAAKDWNDGELKKPPVEGGVPLRVRQGPQKKPPGFQVHIVCLTPFVNGELPGSITALSINSSYGLMTYGNESGLVIVDIIQKTCLMNCATPDLYGAADPYQRVPRSPKKGAEGCGNNKELEERCRSPSTDQILHKDSAKLLEAPIVLSSASSLASSPLKTTPLFDGDERDSVTPGVGYLSNASSQAVTPDEVEEGAEPKAELQQPHGRRRSSAWKGFSLKKQLSRVDQRLKHTFSADHKRGAVFYCASTDSTPPILSPIEGELPLETSLSCGPCADPDPETLGDKPNIPLFETVHDKETSVTKDNKTLLVKDETLSEMGAGESLDVNDELAIIEETPILKVESITDSSPEAIEEAELAEECLIVKEVEDKEESEPPKVEGRPEAPERPSRPMDLPLFDADGRPLRPPRRDGKKRSMVVVERVEKRDVRLLSVPNIKYTSHHHHHEPQLCKGGGEQWVYDLRGKEDITPASFGGLMKRFSKSPAALCSL